MMTEEEKKILEEIKKVGEQLIPLAAQLEALGYKVGCYYHEPWCKEPARLSVTAKKELTL